MSHAVLVIGNITAYDVGRDPCRASNMRYKYLAARCVASNMDQE